jgi:hypothetical protein
MRPREILDSPFVGDANSFYVTRAEKEWQSNNREEVRMVHGGARGGTGTTGEIRRKVAENTQV